MSDVYDLAVIGGGPAGTSAAITAAELGLRVLLFEAKAFPRNKVCGGFVSAEGFSVLERLFGITAFAGAPRISKARLFLDDEIVELLVAPAAVSLSRYDLDLALWRRAEQLGVQVREKAAVANVCQENSHFVVSCEHERARARVVIDASGRWSKLRLEKPKSDSDKRWIGVSAHFQEKSASDSCDLYFFPGGYAGVQPLNDGRINVAAMMRADVARTLAEVVAQNQELQTRSHDWISAGEPVSTAPLFFAAPRTRDRDIALAGDAAAFIDPFAGDGISIALHSGRMATAALARYLRSECSLSAALQAYDSEYRHLIQPALRNAARLRYLLRLPKVLRMGAVALLKLPIVAHAAVQQTRIRHAS